MSNRNLLYVLLAMHFCFLTHLSLAQAVNSAKSRSGNEPASNEMGSENFSLSKKILDAERNYKVDEQLAAQNFVALADELAAKGENAKAETNYNRAISIYKRKKMKAELAATQRKLAKLQENTDKTQEAISNYTAAALNAPSQVSRSLNTNDYNRIQSENLETKYQYAQQNVELLNKAPKEIANVRAEQSDAWLNVASIQGKQNKDKDASQSIAKAIEIDKGKNISTESTLAKLSKELTNDNKIDEAIQLQLNLLQAADSAKNDKLQRNIQERLGILYAQKGNNADAESYLLSAYTSAINNNLTLESRRSLLTLDSFYRATAQEAKAIHIKAEFIRGLDKMLANDASLIDMKRFDESDKRIQQLEQEKLLQADVIRQTKRANNLLLAVGLTIFVASLFLARAFLAISKRNKQIKLQSLRREMNPHFVFNSLNSVNQFIAEHDELKANKYLSAYSTLMRTIMEHSSKDFVPLAVELDHLEKYLALEHQRFQNQFNFTIDIDPEIDIYHVAMPNMIVQPYLENAIWHGLRYKSEKGNLTLRIFKLQKDLSLTIEDDGIGIEESSLLKTQHQKKHKSLGMSNTLERIALLNKLYKTEIKVEVKDLKEQGRTGTLVMISIPIQAVNYES